MSALNTMRPSSPSWKSPATPATGR
jgi:hypothetical protein